MTWERGVYIQRTQLQTFFPWYIHEIPIDIEKEENLIYYAQNNTFRSHDCKRNHTWLFSCDSLEKEYVVFQHLWREEARVLSQQDDVNTDSVTTLAADVFVFPSKL